MATPLRPIFVTGMGRSGTTLLRAILATHSRIAVPPETHFLKNASVLGGLDRDAPADFGAFWDAYVATRNFRNLGLDPEAVRARIDEAGDRSYRTVFASVLTAFAERAGKPRVGEKTPNHVHHVGLLLGWFPEARLLVLRRDPRAVVASQLGSPWVTEHVRPVSLRTGVFCRKRASELGRFASEWNHTYRRALPPWADDPRVRLVRYETLIEEPEAEVRAVCDFIGEDFEPAMITKRSRDTVPTPEVQPRAAWRGWHRDHLDQSLGPIDPRSADKGKQRLAALEIAAVEGWCGAGMREVGYAPTTPLAWRTLVGAGSRGLRWAAQAEEGIRGAARELLKGAVPGRPGREEA